MTEKSVENNKDFLLCKKCHKGYMEPAKDVNLFEFFPKQCSNVTYVGT